MKTFFKILIFCLISFAAKAQNPSTIPAERKTDKWYLYYQFHEADSGYIDMQLHTVSQLANIRGFMGQRVQVLDTARGGVFVFHAPAENLVVDGITIYAAANGYFVRNYYGGVDIRWSGAVGDGATDNRTALKNILNGRYKNVYIPPHGVFLFRDSIVITNTGLNFSTLGGILKLAAPSIAKTPGLKIRADSVRFDLEIDGGWCNRSMVFVDHTSKGSHINIIAHRLGATATTPVQYPTNSILDFAGDGLTSDYIYGDSILNTGRNNNSIPRLITIQDSATGLLDFGKIHGEHIQAGLVTLSTHATVNFDEIVAKDAADQCIYNIHGALFGGRVWYNGNEQAVVLEGGRVRIGSVETFGECIGAVAFDDGPEPSSDRYSDIGEIVITPDSLGLTARSALKVRNHADTIGYMRVGRISGYIRGDYLAQANNDGVTQQVTIGTIDITFAYDSTVCTDGGRNEWISFASAKSLYMGGGVIRIKDMKNTLTEDTRFKLKYPVEPTLNALSYYRGLDVYFVDSSENLTVNGTFEGINLAQQLVTTDHVIWGDNSDDSSVARELKFDNGMFGSINKVPISGYWKQGTNLTLFTAEHPFSIRCITSGIPGVWVSDNEVSIKRVTSTNQIATFYNIGLRDETIISRADSTIDLDLNLPAANSAELYSGGFGKKYVIKNYSSTTDPHIVTLKSPVSGNIIFTNDITSTDFVIPNGASVIVQTNGDDWFVIDYSDSSPAP